MKHTSFFVFLTFARANLHASFQELENLPDKSLDERIMNALAVISSINAIKSARLNRSLKRPTRNDSNNSSS